MSDGNEMRRSARSCSANVRVAEVKPDTIALLTPQHLAAS